jgi:steroid delta-isomerase-like uncharacterized protein
LARQFGLALVDFPQNPLQSFIVAISNFIWGDSDPSLQIMATSESKPIVEDWAKAWSSHDTERVLALFTDDCVYEDVTFGAVSRGKAELRAFADRIFAAIPDFEVALITHFAAENRAGMEWAMSGTHKGDFPGLPATGKRFSSVRGSTIVELQGGKIRRCSDYWDAATVMRQVGLLTPLTAAT